MSTNQERNTRTFEPEQNPDVQFRANGAVVVEYTPQNSTNE